MVYESLVRRWSDGKLRPSVWDRTEHKTLKDWLAVYPGRYDHIPIESEETEDLDGTELFRPKNLSIMIAVKEVEEP